MVDPIADFLTRIRNAQMARKNEVRLPYSNIKFAIANVMMAHKFLTKVDKDETGKFPELVVELPEQKLELKRVSKPGQRIYTSADQIRKVKNGYGISILSTSKGIIAGYQARKDNVGGEVLCEIF